MTLSGFCIHVMQNLERVVGRPSVLTFRAQGAATAAPCSSSLKASASITSENIG